MRGLGRFLIGYSIFVLVLPVRLGASELQAKADGMGEREFQLDYRVTITGTAAGSQVRVWLPLPQSSEDQTVDVLSGKYPAELQTTMDPVYGNRMGYFEVTATDAAPIACQSSFRIKRFEVRGLPGERPARKMTLSEAERKLHLAPNRKVPLTGKSLQLLQGVTLPTDSLARARVFYDRVDEHVKYDKSRPGYGQGDVNWVCDSRFGNCTDFHSLFLSWARSHDLPARFEIGFPLPDQRGQGEISGYHCWAFFYADGHGWVPVDISEADKNPALKEYFFGHLTENRVTFTTGRDLNLVPRQAGEPLNFFVYPYVEVGGQPLPKEQVQLAVTFRDL